MRLLVAHARAHRLPGGWCVCLLASVIAWQFRDVNRLGFETGWFREPPYPVILMCPLLAACAAIAVLYEPFIDLERSLTHRAWQFRATLIAALLIPTGGAFAFALAPHSGDVGMALRNLAAMSGIAAWFALLIGCRLAWMPTSMYCLAAYLASAGNSLDHAGLPDIAWTWPLLPSDDLTALGVSTALAAGTVVLCWRGPQELVTV